MRLKLQSAVEFLITYGWAFILIAIFISVVVVLLTPSSVTSLAPSSCYISPGLPCYSFSVFSNSSESTVTVSFSNNLGTQMRFPNNGITVKIANYKNYTGVCLPANAVNGALVSCVAEMPGLSLPVGSQAYSVFTISYNLCSQGSCSSVVYNTSGSATAAVSGLALT